MHADSLALINPFPVCVDSRQRNRCTHDGACRDLHFVNSFDDSLKCATHVLSSLVKKTNGVRVPVDTCAVCQAILLREDGRAAPPNELGFNFDSLCMSTNRTIAAMSSQAFYFSHLRLLRFSLLWQTV
jgi:hypothetical protein